jgi:hypothetical protein
MVQKGILNDSLISFAKIIHLLYTAKQIAVFWVFFSQCGGKKRADLSCHL